MSSSQANPSAAACHAASVSHLADICDYVSQRAHEIVSAALLSRQRPAQIGRLLDRAFGEGLRRSRMLAEHAVTQAYSQAALDALEARGVTHVGTVSERAARKATTIADLADEMRFTPQPQHPRTGRFAEEHVVARETRRSPRTGRFRPQGISLAQRRKEERAEAAFAKVKGKVDILTAEDDKVCARCEEVSENGPYTINKARSLIPLHFHCRCQFVAAGSMAMDTVATAG